MPGKFVVTDEGAVFYMEGGKDLPAVRDDLGGQLAVRVLKFLERGDFCKHPHEQQQEQDQGERGGDQYPKPLYYFFLRCVFHFLIYD